MSRADRSRILVILACMSVPSVLGAVDAEPLRPWTAGGNRYSTAGEMLERSTRFAWAHKFSKS